MIPRNEQETIALFAQLAHGLGYEFKRMGTRCPDAVLTNNGDEVRVEFEYTSMNFKRHNHSPDKVDLVICWQDDWPECPLPVLELETYVTLVRPKPRELPIPRWRRFVNWLTEFRIALHRHRYEVKVSRLQNRHYTCSKCGSIMIPKCHYDRKYKYQGNFVVSGALRIRCLICGYTELEWLYDTTKVYYPPSDDDIEPATETERSA